MDLERRLDLWARYSMTTDTPLSDWHQILDHWERSFYDNKGRIPPYIEEKLLVNIGGKDPIFLIRLCVEDKNGNSIIGTGREVVAQLQTERTKLEQQPVSPEREQRLAYIDLVLTSPDPPDFEDDLYIDNDQDDDQEDQDPDSDHIGATFKFLGMVNRRRPAVII